MPIYTSTPNVSNRNVIFNSESIFSSTNSSPASPFLQENKFATAVKINSDQETPIPQNIFKSPKSRKSEPTPQNQANKSSSLSNISPNDIEYSTHRASDSAQQASTSNIFSSHSNQSSTVTETPKFPVASVRRILSIPDDTTEEYPEKENETTCVDTTEQTVYHETFREVKVCRAALSPLKSSHLNSNNNITTESQTANRSTKKISKSLKRKSSETGRPRRQARPDPSQLKEPSLRTKLRRSKKV